MSGANSVTSNQETLHKDLEEVHMSHRRQTIENYDEHDNIAFKSLVQVERSK